MTKNELNNIIKADLYRVYGATGKKSLIRTIKNNPGFKYIYLLRKCNYFKTKSMILHKLYYMLLKKYEYKYGLEIPFSTSIGEGFYIGHIGGIVINPNAKIGKNVNILKGVLIGYNPRGYNKGCPTIRDNVWVGPNAVIVGNITIGNNVLIAPNSLINFDVPDNSVVSGNPAKITSKNGAVDMYINYTLSN